MVTQPCLWLLLPLLSPFSEGNPPTLALPYFSPTRCYEMERRLKTPELFKFPYFEAICWYVAKNLLETLKGEQKRRGDECERGFICIK